MTTTAFNTKISVVGNKIPDMSRLVTTDLLNTKTGEAERKILDHIKYITTEEFNKLTGKNFCCKIKSKLI